MAAQSTTADEYRVHDRLDAVATTLVVILCLVWGLNYVSMKVVNLGFQPIFVAGLRFALAAVVIFFWCLFRRIPLFGADGTLIPGIIAGFCSAPNSPSFRPRSTIRAHRAAWCSPTRCRFSSRSARTCSCRASG